MLDKNNPQINLASLKEIARDLRLDILDMTTKAGSGHPSSSFSAVEILTALYFGGILNYRPDEPWWPERDRFIMSKGHAAPLLYAVLARAGYFDRQRLWQLRQIDSPVQGHPIQGMLPGVEATTGSLGQGLSLGLGHILQETGPVSREMALEPLVAKWESFGWGVSEVDGHDIGEVMTALGAISEIDTKPSMIIAHTVKGKGVSFVEQDFTFHGRALKPEQAEKAREEISWQ